MAKKRHAIKKRTKRKGTALTPAQKLVRASIRDASSGTGPSTGTRPGSEILTKSREQDGSRGTVADLKTQLSKQDFEKFSKQIIKQLEEVDKSLERKFKLIDKLIQDR